MTMAIFKRNALNLPILGRATGRLAMLPVFVAAITVADLPRARAAEAVPSVAPAVKVGSHSAKPPRAGAESAHTPKQTAAKPKSRPREVPRSVKLTPASVAKPTLPSAVKPPPAAAAKQTSAPAAKPTQVMDFNTDEVEGQRLEPGFDLIQAPPQRAHHPSMVPASPRPEDSVVRGN